MDFIRPIRVTPYQKLPVVPFIFINSLQTIISCNTFSCEVCTKFEVFIRHILICIIHKYGNGAGSLNYFLLISFLSLWIGLWYVRASGAQKLHQKQSRCLVVYNLNIAFNLFLNTQLWTHFSSLLTTKKNTSTHKCACALMQSKNEMTSNLRLYCID